MMKIRTIYWENDAVVMIDQKALPVVERTVACREYGQVIAAINDLTIRGAPAIGVAAAMGIALGALRIPAGSPDAFQESFAQICREFSQTRPTARNLFWAVERMKKCLERALAAPAPKPPKRPSRMTKTRENRQISLFGPLPQDAQGDETPQEPWGLEIRKALVEEAVRIGEEDIEINRRIGAAGKYLIATGDRILTHCNAGALATAGYGTALGVVRAAWAEGKKIHLFIDETRPVLQGARLTTWEMMKEGIPATLITDSMAGFLMQQKRIDKIIVGADRIARNGDTANKIGTYSLAILAKAHGIPLYVAAPLSTIDASITDGTEIPIEERGADEVTHAGGFSIAPAGIAVYNPAFDVTPHDLITAIITEAGRVVPPFGKKIPGLFGQ